MKFPINPISTFAKRVINKMNRYMKGASIFFVALFLLITTLANYSLIVDLIRSVSLEKILSVESDVIPQQIEGALRYKRNDIELNFYLQFKSVNEPPYQNLFQTDYSNTGIRAELSGGTLAVIINNAENTAKPHIIIFPITVSPGEWYELSIQAIENGKITANLNQYSGGKRPTSIPLSIDNAKFSLNNLIVGNGFDTTRKFQGDIANIKITANKRITKSTASYIYFILVGTILLLTFKLFNFNFKSYKSPISKCLFRNILILRGRLFEFIPFFSIVLIVFSCINSILGSYLANKSRTLVETLLPSFQPIKFVPLYKSELIIFLVIEFIVIGWYMFINLKINLSEKFSISKNLQFIPYISFIYCSYTYLYSPRLIDEAVFYLSCISVAFYTFFKSRIFKNSTQYNIGNVK